MLALPIFPGRRQPSIVSRDELNYRVRNGNGWTLALISTNFVFQFPGELFQFYRVDRHTSAKWLPATPQRQYKLPEPAKAVIEKTWCSPFISQSSSIKNIPHPISDSNRIRCLHVYPQNSNQQAVFPYTLLNISASIACPYRNNKNCAKAKRKTTVIKLSSLCWHYLSFRAVASQVLSAETSLTTVFGMGTGGPSL